MQRQRDGARARMRVREDASCRRMQRSNNRRGSSTGLGDQRLKCRVHIQWTLEVYIPVYMSRMRCIVPVPWRYSTVCWTPKRKDSEKRKDSVETRLNASQSCTHAICTGLESCMGRGSMKCSRTRDTGHGSPVESRFDGPHRREPPGHQLAHARSSFRIQSLCPPHRVPS